MTVHYGGDLFDPTEPAGEEDSLSATLIKRITSEIKYSHGDDNCLLINF